MIISEFCQNHSGDKDILFNMIDAAADAGARFCKIQTFFADDLADRSVFPGRGPTPEYVRMKALELDWATQAKFCGRVKGLGMVPMTSVYTAKYHKELHACGFEWLKIGSAQADNTDLIATLKALGFKVIISTGGHDLESMPRLGPIEGVLHCVSEYPHHPYKANIGRMLELKKYWPNTPVGFSSHVDPLDSGWRYPLYLASYLGATFIEVHFTIQDRRATKDGPVSLDADQLKQLCSFDKESRGVKLRFCPTFGIISCDQRKEELELINKYKSRWI